MKEEDGKKNVYLYDTAHSDVSDASLIKSPKSKTKDLGPVSTVDTTDGQKDKIKEKYGAVHGLVVSL